MSSSINVVKLAFSSDWKVLAGALSQGSYDVEECLNASEALTCLSGASGALIIASLRKKEDLVHIMTLVKSYKKVAPDTVVKVVVVNFSNDRQFEKAVQKLGILDIVDPNVNVKALKFKIDFWAKGITAQVKKNGGGKAEKEAAAAAAAKGPQAKIQDPNEPVYESPLEIEDDIWLIKNDGDVKKLIGRWMMKLMGPSPYVAEWKEVRSKRNVWRFEFKGQEKELFAPGDGHWYYRGDTKPEFQWKENLWLFSGLSHDLFYQTKEKTYARATVKNKQLFINKNSLYAKTKEEIIIESFDKEVVFKRDASLATNEEVDTDGGTDKLNGNLEGDSSTDLIDTGPLEGKNSAEEDLGGRLEGKSSTDKFDDGSLEGDLGTDNLGSKPLKGKKTKNDNSADGTLSQYLDENENRIKDEDMKGPPPEKSHKGAELALDVEKQEHKTKYRGHNEAEEFGEANWDAPAPDKHRDGAELGMKVEKQEHKTKYRGHNEAEEFAEGELGGEGYEADRLSSHMGHTEYEKKKKKEEGLLGGRSETDHLDNYYGREGDDEDSEESEDRAEREKRNRRSRADRDREDEQDDYYDPDQPDESGKSPFEQELEKRRANKELAEARERLIQAKAKKEGRSPDEVRDEVEEKEEKAIRKALKEKAELEGKKSRPEDEADLGGAYGGRSKTDKISAHYKKRDPNQTDDEEEDYSEEEGPVSRQKKSKKSPGSSRIEEDDENQHQDEDSGYDEDSRGLERRQKKKSRSSREDDGFDFDEARDAMSRGRNRSSRDSDGDADDNVRSLEDARRVRELRENLHEKEDPELDEATENAEVLVSIIQDHRRYQAKLDDSFDQTLIFLMPEVEIVLNSKVLLEMSFKYLNKTARLNLQGQAMETHPDGEGKTYLTVEIEEAAVTPFGSFMKLFQIRQKNIDFFLKKAKGL